MRLTNEGDVAVGVAADARLLTLEVTERSARKPVRCELPADMRPSDEAERALVVPPKRSYEESFEPRLYCFSVAAEDALAPGAIMVARLGRPGAESKPPFVVWAIDGVNPEVASMRSVTSDPIALPDDPTQVPADVLEPIPRPWLAVEGPRAVDALSPGAIEIPVTLRNDGSRAVVVPFRPETLRFDVADAAGVADCPWPTPPTAPTRELFTRVPPRGAARITVLLGAYCAAHTLDKPGLLVVRPRLDTRTASGDTIGLRSFEGLVIATKPTLVRLHRGEAKPSPLRLPTLAP